MKPSFRNPFAAALIAAALTASTYAQTTLLTDNFDIETSFTADPNPDQGGFLSPASYTVQNPSWFGYTGVARRGDTIDVLELGFDGTNATQGARVFTNADYVTVANTLNSPVRITFNIDASQVDWVGLVVGTTDAWLDANGSLTEFSALFNNAGGGTRWVNGSGANFTETDTSSLITLELSNTAGTGSPFNGTGSVAKLKRGDTQLGTTYTLDQLTATNGKFAVCAWNNGGAGGTFDNLTITTTTTPPNRWSGAVDGNWDETTDNFTGGDFATIKTNGATSAIFGDVSGTLAPVTNSSLTIATDGVEIDNVIFDNTTSVDYSLASSGGAGIMGASNLIKSGSGLLTVGNVNTYNGATTISGGELILSGGANRLPVTTALTLTIPGMLRLDGNNQEVASISSNGRVVNGNATLATFTVNNSAAATFSGNLGGTGTDEDNLTLVKNGEGILALTAPNTFTGGTTINQGTLLLAYGDPFATNSSVGPLDDDTTVTINSSNVDETLIPGILTGTNNNWLATTSVSSGGTNAPTVTVNSGGILRGGDGFVSGLGNVTLNGGTLEVTNGYGQWGWNACFNLGGDITVTGSTASEITTAAGAGVNAVIYMSNGSNGTGGTRSFIVDDVTSGSDLIVSARMAKGTVVKDGDGTVEIALGETGTEAPADWQIKAGEFLLAEGATFEFRVTDTTSNRVYQAFDGTGSAAFNGTLNINTGAVTSTTGMIWSLIDVTGLGATFGTNFAVGGDFSETSSGSGVWTKSDTIGDWSFDESTGELNLDVGSDYDTWKSDNGVVGTETDDDDADGMNNFDEYAFGLDPTGGTSVNPITVALDKTSKSFSYTRRDSSLPDPALDYSVWFSTDLATWTEDTEATEGATTLNGEVETVPVTLSTLPGDTLPAKFFIRMKAEQP